MLDVYKKVRVLFPGKKFSLLMLNVLGTFFLALVDVVGITAILPIVSLNGGAEITGYLATISNIFGNPDRSTLVLYLATLMVGIFILKAVASLIFRRWSIFLIARQELASGVALLRDFVTSPYDRVRKVAVDDVVTVISYYNTAAYSSYMNALISLVSDMLSVIVIMAMLYIAMPLQAFIATVYFGVVIFGMQYVLKNINKRQGKRSAEASRRSMESLLANVNGFREIRLAGTSDRYLYRYQKASEEGIVARANSSFLFELPKYTLEIIFIIGVCLLMLFPVTESSTDNTAYLLLFCAAGVRMLPYATRLVASLGSIRSSEVVMQRAVDRLSELSQEGVEFSLIPEPAQRTLNIIDNEDKATSEVSVRDISYRYPDGEKNVLSHVSLDIPSGSSVAFVGGSGSGKTTLVDLILGLLKPTDGTILGNSQNISENTGEWYKGIGYVPQDPYMGNMPLREAVAFGFVGDEIDDERVYKCLEQAELMDIVDTLEDGIHTMIGERGSRLSGGQRQRVGIARALYRNPSLLILDEATSALDNETEHKITQTIENISGDVTVIIVAHRLSTVRHVDQLIYLANGEIQASGTFEEVQAKNKDFARLVELGKL
ncbi:MAG: ABC transporter ATP-binding protein [Rothia sp. (in: high G+C Gram-positive bacteria)]|uniref:ABC transporter ATP-binding protein n=1 Tax=Rothia sp. (in: high G+C Gram-positive bacteria) TaxID=1885016 RepID=UPI0026E107A7|nr:ABC transporter ATP-binding protein [Rothia sp. (in: high G+C Gram-positive bacteria)]MDO5750270.1 ABC transporter ATP-binding protein [Rothia sp. (in: high G+C Gram-positive bacteria)]